jgi:hypothetical protein
LAGRQEIGSGTFIRKSGRLIEPPQTASWIKARKWMRLMSIPLTIIACPACLVVALWGWSRDAQLLENASLAFAILAAALSVSLVYRTRMENDPDRPALPVIASSALLVFLALAFEIFAVLFVAYLLRH